MSKTIEQDNLEKLEQYKDCKPNASYISGMIDGDGCIFIRKITDGYQSGITLAQSRTNVLQILRYHFGGSITTSANRNCNITDKIVENGYFDKHNVRNEYNLIIRSNEYDIILKYIKEHIIIKQKQFESLYEFNKIVHIPHKKLEKEDLYNCCLKKREIFDYDFSRLNIEYIQGLFDAEGCVYIDKHKYTNYTISIAQKNHPEILHKIQELLGYGKLDKYSLLISKKKDCLTFIQLMKPGVIVKYNQVCAFETFLNTTDPVIKEQMYRITNEEKHKIEHFTELNQSNEGKQGYKEAVHNEEITKQEIKKEHIIEVYKQKSESMMGKGNHNFGKQFSEETKQKMSVSIRDAKGSVSDEIILKVRQLIQEGNTNVKIQELMELPRHTVTRIKNGIIICRNEERKEIKSMSQEKLNISKRKIKLNELLIVIALINDGQTYADILDKINNPLVTINIVKNIKQKMCAGITPFYESELSEHRYYLYKTLIFDYKEKNKIIYSYMTPTYIIEENIENVNTSLFKYKIDVDLDDTNKYVKQITFDINRNRLYTHTLTFSNPVTQKIAVLEVEKWLSEKLTEEYFNIIVKDKFKNNTDTFDMYKDSIKGTLLGSSIFLEEITNITESHIFISCGS